MVVSDQNDPTETVNTETMGISDQNGPSTNENTETIRISDENCPTTNGISTEIVKSKRNVKVFRARQKTVKGVPPEIANDPKLLAAIEEKLPGNYDFEIPKTVHRCQQFEKGALVVLQMPEGLQRFAGGVAELLEEFAGVAVMVAADVAYGACCVDDVAAKMLGASLLVHYGHSCLVPNERNSVPAVLYVFVDIKFDTLHLVDKIKAVFPVSTPLALVSIVQFVASLQRLAVVLRQGGYDVLVPQTRPLSPGEVLGCTSPPLPSHPRYTVLALGDGRFHLESIMIHNPELDTYLYNPYNKVLSREYYDQPQMKRVRKNAIDVACKAQLWGLVYSTLGRQGNDAVRARLQAAIEGSGRRVVSFDHDHLDPSLLATLDGQVGAWVQVCCPRLSIDWGGDYSTPLLNPYECMVACKQTPWSETHYPMDYYANSSLGPWTPNHVPPCPCGKAPGEGCKGKRCPEAKGDSCCSK